MTRVRFARRTAETMVCGGCGAKLGASSLARALAQIDAGAPSNVVIGARNADDAAVLAPSIHPLAVTVDGFRELVSDPFRFARIALNHAMGDAYAMGAQPSGVLATVTVRHADDVLKERDLSQVLKGIESMLKPIGVPLLGGHSAEGAEFNLGFTVLASLDGGHALRKDGLRPDDYIVLTKPLGTGVLFAAQMRGSARHEWLRDAMTGMERLLNVEAGLFVKHNVRGCTDVTGFGLLGHASEMARASNVVLDLAWDRVPVYNGALFCMAAGVHSSLQSNNEQAVDDYDVGTMSRSDPRLRILVDPQTCGGLLAGVAADDLHACLSELRVAGCDAWVIGRAFAASTGRTSRVAFGAQIAGLSDRRIGVCT